MPRITSRRKRNKRMTGKSRRKSKRGGGGHKILKLPSGKYMEHARTGHLYEYPEEWNVYSKCLKYEDNYDHVSRIADLMENLNENVKKQTEKFEKETSDEEKKIIHDNAIKLEEEFFESVKEQKEKSKKRLETRLKAKEIKRPDDEEPLSASDAVTTPEKFIKDGWLYVKIKKGKKKGHYEKRGKVKSKTEGGRRRRKSRRKSKRGGDGDEDVMKITLSDGKEYIKESGTGDLYDLEQWHVYRNCLGSDTSPTNVDEIIDLMGKVNGTLGQERKRKFEKENSDEEKKRIRDEAIEIEVTALEDKAEKQYKARKQQLTVEQKKHKEKLIERLEAKGIKRPDEGGRNRRRKAKRKKSRKKRKRSRRRKRRR